MVVRREMRKAREDIWPEAAGKGQGLSNSVEAVVVVSGFVWGRGKGREEVLWNLRWERQRT